MASVRCPRCGGTDDLVGTDTADGKVIDCENCGNRWDRDLTPMCRGCGSTDLEAVPTATIEEAGRGEQRTPSGIRDAYRCWSCGARDATSSNPLPPEPDWQRPVRAAGPERRTRTVQDVDDTVRIDSAFGRFEVDGLVSDRWRLMSLVATTSTGTLWEAAATDTGTRVVFKLVHRRLGADLVAQHAASARLVKDVRHPNLLRVLDVIRQGQDTLLVLEPVDAATLAAVGAMAPDGLGQLAAGVSDALATLHDHRVAHLDIRPANILVPAAGRPRLVDLGTGRVRARAASTAPDDARLAWLAPEQILSREHRAAADVYALGLTLWAVAGGDLTRLGVNAAAQASTRLRGDLPRLGPPPAGAPAGFVDAVAAATRRQPGERPTARELARQLAT